MIFDLGCGGEVCKGGLHSFARRGVFGLEEFSNPSEGIPESANFAALGTYPIRTAV